MNIKKNAVLLFAILLGLVGFTQKKSIRYQTNGTDSLIHDNPFQKFIGEWTLKEDSWTQNWGGETETIKIPYHHTVMATINTKNSLLQIIDGPQPNGHIFWSYNPVTKKVNHLSSFGESRAGVGQGSISENGDITLQITFEGEPKNTYRIYKYQWINPDEYHMRSVQYGIDDIPTGLFYEGSFVRLPHRETVLETEIQTILSVLDNNDISVEKQLEVYAHDVVHMAPGSEANIGREALGQYLQEQRQYGTSKMKHDIVEFEDVGDLILMRGKVTGTFYPRTGEKPVEFQTKNLFVFSNGDGGLKIAKVIYNASPPNHK